uniref:Uncharacterized protein n=1 Tax=Alexandrium catenella TaxID=2925 RepID=A0A7S1RBJ8_ALECA
MRMAAMRILLVCLALAPTMLDAKKEKAEKAAKTMTPIITTDLVYGTFELFYDIYDEARGFVTQKAGPVLAPVVDSMATHLPKDPLAELCAKIGVKKAEITDRVAGAQAALLHAKSIAVAKSAQAYEPLNALAVSLIDAFERLLPKYAGLIPKNLGDLLLFQLYFFVVVYLLYRVASRVLGILRGIICGVCCCCCRRRSKSVKPAAEGSKAANKGKAAAAAKKNGKK